MHNKEKLLSNLKTLSERGVGGEKENAKILLQKLLNKYDIKESSIDITTIQVYALQYKNLFEKKLINQCLYSVVGDVDDNKYAYTTKKRSTLFIRCTNDEYLDVIAKYEFYKYHFNKDINLFYYAFIKKNNIYPSRTKVKEYANNIPTEQDLKISNIANGLDKHEQLFFSFKNHNCRQLASRLVVIEYSCALKLV